MLPRERTVLDTPGSVLRLGNRILDSSNMRTQPVIVIFKGTNVSFNHFLEIKNKNSQKNIRISYRALYCYNWVLPADLAGR